MSYLSGIGRFRLPLEFLHFLKRRQRERAGYC